MLWVDSSSDEEGVGAGAPSRPPRAPLSPSKSMPRHPLRTQQAWAEKAVHGMVDSDSDDGEIFFVAKARATAREHGPASQARLPLKAPSFPPSATRPAMRKWSTGSFSCASPSTPDVSVAEGQVVPVGAGRDLPIASDVSTTDGEAEEKPKARASRHAKGDENHCLSPIARKRGRTRGTNHSDSGHSSSDGEDRNEVPLSRFRGSEHASASCTSSLSKVSTCQTVRKPGRCPAQRGAGGKELEEGGAEGEEEEEEEEERILHPTFEKPLFKGVEEALVLGYEEDTAEEAEIEGGKEGMDRGRGATGVVMDASPGPPVRQRPVTVPLAASRYLYDYQKEGVRCLSSRYAGW